MSSAENGHWMPLKEEQPGELWDRQGNHFLVFDIDGTREACTGYQDHPFSKIWIKEQAEASHSQQQMNDSSTRRQHPW
jgi:hypothetical protein